MAAAPSPCRLGVLAFGDSITNGGGELQWGVALQSWALWTARALGLPYTGYARDGARAADVIAEQVPALARDAPAGARWDLGVLYIGVNDVRALDWDRDAFARDHEQALRTLAQRCDRVLAVTIPLDLGRPRAGHVDAGNAVIRANARAVGALVLDLRSFRGRNLVMADHVHPTAFGQIAIARRALAVLAADGLPAKRDPAELIAYETTWRGRLRGDLTYAYRHAKVTARAAWIRAAVARERRAAPAAAARSGRRGTAAARTPASP
jgi:lysophospholipase L1-like esterase